MAYEIHTCNYIFIIYLHASRKAVRRFCLIARADGTDNSWAAILCSSGEAICDIYILHYEVIGVKWVTVIICVQIDASVACMPAGLIRAVDALV